MIPKKLERNLLKVQKPGRYIGGEPGSVHKDKTKVDERIAFCFPDMYEVGMSHLGMKILYSLYNSRENFWCERVFAPDVDMEDVMRSEGILLYGLESFDPIKDFDFIAFTLQYEMSYTGVLNMLDLAGLPVRASERKELSPIVIAGGPCACNPEPLTAFVDLFLIGEGEEVNLEITELHLKAKNEGWSKEQYLHEAAKIPGVYVPSLYDVTYHEDGTIKAVTPIYDDIPEKITKRIIVDMDKVFYPDKFVVPFVEPVHDRAMVEVLRGCIRGCRFCQAGFIYRPFREKRAETIDKCGKALCDSTGYNEISLTSLSTSDLSEIEPLLDKMLTWSQERKINLSLPSLRVDNFSEALLEKIAKVRKSGLTFAPEGGTQRIRDVINKNVSEEEIMNTCRTAFEGGYTNVKLYFMMGLPTETDDDIRGIAVLAQKIVDMFYAMPNRPKGKGVNVSISCACFVPKPFTPFQFEPQDTMEEFDRKQKLLRSSITTRKVTLSCHDASTSFVEEILAKGDRRLCDVVELAWKKGSRLDGWSEHLDIERWTGSMKELGLDAAFYANRRRAYDEIEPWEHLDYGVSKEFLIRENKLAHADTTTPNCKQKCSACAANKLLKGEKCVAAKYQDFLRENGKG
ncbi:MAG: TIGR03960 family B12-binding radical SAM protein [Oscillospiraceae bacterium]|nr:TIGR03960 family B12-binding radical SAM protein [Oscillospiraceae bacterium]